MELKEKIDKNKLPVHVAVIMDGNGRWAKEKGQHRVFGHSQGVKSVREVTEAAAELGIQYLTLFAFSTENWNRPHDEVSALMSLLISTLESETKTLMENNIRLKVMGNLDLLPVQVREGLDKAVKKTEANSRMTLVLALSYSARWEISNAARKIARDVQAGIINPSDVDEQLFARYLLTYDIPDPDMLIRTSGEYRISNFLLWQIAYAELYFIHKYWPDVRKEDFYQAILDYQQRERRFGKISEQIKLNL